MYWLRLPLLGASDYDEVEERAKPEAKDLPETSVSKVLRNSHLLSEVLKYLDSRSLCQAQVRLLYVLNPIHQDLTRHPKQARLVSAGSMQAVEAAGRELSGDNRCGGKRKPCCLRFRLSDRVFDTAVSA